MKKNYRYIIGLSAAAFLLIMVGQTMADLASWNAEITAANPLNWYKFDEASGTDCIDSGSDGLNGTYSGVTLGRNGALGAGTAARFDLLSDSVVSFSGASAVYGDWTAEYIVKKLSTGTSQALHDDAVSSIRLEGYEAGGNTGFTLYGVLDYYFTAVLGESIQAPVEQWSHVVFRRNDDGTQVFIDGRMAGTHTSSVNLPRAMFGHHLWDTGSSDQLDAVLDEAVVYDRALTNEEIERHAYIVLPNLIPDYFELYADSAELQALWSGDAALALETTEVYDGSQAMKAEFAAGGSIMKDVGREFDYSVKAGQDFILMLKGDAANDPGDVTVSVVDPNGAPLQSMTYPNGTQETTWVELKGIVPGLFDPNNSLLGAAGVQIDVGAAATMYFDNLEIRIPPHTPVKIVEWAFNDGGGKVATDTSGNDIDGAMNGFSGGSWVAGRSGNSGDYAIEFDGSNNQTIIASNVDLSGLDVDDIFSGFSSWTINVWLNFPRDDRISMIGGFGDCDFFEGDGYEDRYFNQWDNTVEFNYGEYGFWYIGLEVDTWEMWTLTYNKWSRTLTFYRNAERITTLADILIDTSENSIKLGNVGDVAWADASQVALMATIDDFCIWDGELPWMDDDPETDDVLSLYGDWICYETPAYDVDGDCQVNLADLAELISAWLESGRHWANP